ncbi:MAG TPA: hypothetical protein VFE47_27090 [Tepidisphaeraceae bacterium]|jgi:hypothetical protein|nr:hypothetical protein [Tepidisphaeraceae bacterium]
MAEDNTHCESQDDAESHKRDGHDSKSLSYALQLIGIVGASAYIIADLSGHWTDWWMKYGLVWIFVFAVSYAVYGASRKWFHWSRLSAFIVGGFAFVILALITLIAYAGGSMPLLPMSIKSRFAIPILLSCATLIAWGWAIRRPQTPRPTVPPAKRPATDPQTAPSTLPTTNPAPATEHGPTRQSAEAVRRRLNDIHDSIDRLHGEHASDAIKHEYLRILQTQVAEVYFYAVDNGMMQPMAPPIIRSPRGPLDEWRNLAERIDSPLVPRLDKISRGKTVDGRYVDHSIGVTAWIDHASAIAAFLRDQIGTMGSPAQIPQSLVMRAAEFVDQVMNQIPPDCIPAQGQWHQEQIDRANRAVSHILHRELELVIEVSETGAARDGRRYHGITRVLAQIPYSQSKKLSTLLWAYFEGADEESKRFIVGHRKNEQISVRGTVTQSLVKEMGEKGCCLNIDLNNCNVLHPAKSLVVAAQPFPIGRNNPGRTFEVLCQQFGSLKNGDQFTDHEFRKSNPPPPNCRGDKEATDEYYEDIYAGHLTKQNPPIRVVEK